MQKRYDVRAEPFAPLQAEPRQAPSPRIDREAASPAGLIRSTLLAATAAAAILVTVVLPAEYDIDPTGVGAMLGLTEMGEIKQQLYAEAEADEALAAQAGPASAQAVADPQIVERLAAIEAQLDRLATLVDAAPAPSQPATAQPGTVQAAPLVPREAIAATAEQPASDWRDEISFTLAPGESAEWKLVMQEGDSAQYRMMVEGGLVNFDLHGHGAGQSVTYQRERGSAGAEGEINATFAGEHGWFWRNRDSGPLTVRLQVRGEYSEFKNAG